LERRERGVYRIFVGKSKGEDPLGRFRHKWEDNIQIDLKEGWECADWICLRILTSG
jgi:hypothetical protein